MTRAFLQTKTGEVEGTLTTKAEYAGTQCVRFACVNDSVFWRSDSHNGKAAALAHFEEHFGRIHREDG